MLWLVVAAVFAVVARSGSEVDAVWGTVNNPIRSIGFGSCAKQFRDQSFWPRVAQSGEDGRTLDGWFWLGDIVYSPCPSITCVQDSYAELETKSSWQHFREQVPVDGVWDDHDYGLNDAGNSLGIKKESQEMLLDFLRVPPNSPRRDRDGVYSSHRLVLGANHTAKVILLDTRKHRGPPAVAAVGEWHWLPGASYLAAALRCVTALAGVASEGDMLGEPQWRWLEETLLDSREHDTVTILASSIQVLTTNPIFESWSHFPSSQRRLVSLLERVRPPGLMIVSGDVHFAQMLGDKSCVIETTTSGMTHSVQDHLLHETILLKVLQPLLGQNYSPDETGGKRISGNRNFAVVSFSPSRKTDHATLVEASIRDIQTGQIIMAYERVVQEEEVFDYSCLQGYKMSAIRPRLPIALTVAALCVASMAIMLALLVVRVLIHAHSAREPIKYTSIEVAKSSQEGGARAESLASKLNPNKTYKFGRETDHLKST